jgi:hypothetical protein
MAQRGFSAIASIYFGLRILDFGFEERSLAHLLDPKYWWVCCRAYFVGGPGVRRNGGFVLAKGLSAED